MKRLVLALALVASLAACGGDDEGPGVATAGGNVAPTASAEAGADGDRMTQLLAFTQCMRDNGVAVNDPDPGAGLAGFARITEGIDPDDPVVQAAYDACRANLPNAGEGPTLNAEQVERYLAFADCMRTNGVEEMPDPGPDGSIQIDPGMVSLLQDPTFQAAFEACRESLTGLVTAMASELPR